MDQQAPQISHHLLEVQNPELGELDETAKDFLEQNLVVSKEIEKYDNMLSSSAMIIYRIYLVVLIFCNVAPFAVISVTILQATKPSGILAFIYPVLRYVSMIVMVMTAWGCLLVWKAISKKSEERIDKAILSFVSNLGILMVLTSLTMLDLFISSNCGPSFLTSLWATLLTLISILPAKYVQDVLKKRKPFYESSSYSIDQNIIKA